MIKIYQNLKKIFYNFQSLKNIFQFLQTYYYSDQLSKIIEEENPDIIYVHEFIALNSIRLIFNRNKSLFSNKIIIYDAHEIEAHRNPPKDFFSKLFINHIEIKTLQKLKARIISVSDIIGAFYSKKINKELIYIIKNYPSQINFYQDHDQFINAVNIKTAYQNFKSISIDQKLGIFVGNIALNRGIEELIQLISYFPKVYLCFVGKISSTNHYDKIVTLINNLELDNRIHFLKPVDNHKVVSCIQSADFSFIPIPPITLSYYFCSPNKLHESKAAQLPIFAQSLPEFEQELYIETLNPVGKTTDFFDLPKAKTDFENFLNNLNMFKENYQFIQPKFFDDEDQYAIYSDIFYKT